MVIIDEEAASPLKQGLQIQQSHTDEAESVASASAPPTYDSLRPAAARPLLPPKRVEPAGKRFFKAFFLSLLIYVLLLAVGRGIWEARHHNKPHSRPSPRPPYDPAPGDPDQPGPVPPGSGDPGQPPPGSPGLPTPPGKVVGIWCHDFSSQSPTLDQPSPGFTGLKVSLAAIFWTSGNSDLRRPRYKSLASFEFPEDVPLFFVKNDKGGSFGGDFRIESSQSASDEIAVDVTTYYDSTDVLDRVKLCRVRNDDGAEGLTIGLPDGDHSGDSSDRLSFDITVRLPKGPPRAIKHLQSLEVTLDYFTEHISDLQGLFKFENVNVQGTSGPIHVESISATEATFKAAYGRITGSYFVDTFLDISSVSGALDIEEASATNCTVKTEHGGVTGSFTCENIEIATTSGRVDAEIELTKVPGGSSTAILSTAYGAVRSEFTLSSAEDGIVNNEEGVFDINVSSESGALTIEFNEQPVSSTLRFKGRSTTGSSHVTLHPAYEGEFILQNTVESPVVSYEDWSDPSGHGRHRRVDITPSKSPLKKIVSGTARWLDESPKWPAKHGDGLVEMSAAYGQIRLDL